ncbi:phage terminase small subunit P27 family [Ancylobacter oerskovii]|uniref:Phage terminase small subunit P27 family n=1 Tax=Ancylobacter oerskovii TaxID=459519 RepID=A0ABW4Z154_9HYPH|nr:phage terminase small subunit P27 family [Ancylobacter oerskovii]MBS7545107.1 phage terminase small subunit P27 family [Ancylobacter oerskovii]
MNVIDGTGQIVPEPHWRMLLTDDLEIDAATEYWRAVTTELRERNLLAPANRHAIQRLVLAYVIYDRSVRDVAENGAVTKPKRGNPKAIARVSPHFTAMREAANDAATLEAELGLSPRRRGAVTKVERKARAARASDEFKGKAAG